jgi:tetratricopeptide (TPR) repeat protein
VSIAKTKDPSLEKAEVWQLKEQSKGHIKLGQYEQALKLLEQIEEGTQTDIELLDLKGICLMNLKRFEEASIHFSRSVLLDQYYSKKVYISLALCENQLNHADRCLHYVRIHRLRSISASRSFLIIMKPSTSRESYSTNRNCTIRPLICC